jgi:hypothetical protein
VVHRRPSKDLQAITAVMMIAMTKMIHTGSIFALLPASNVVVVGF